MPKLTKTVVDAAKAGDRRIYIWDSKISGFGLQVLPSGVKSFVFQYRSAENRSRRATLGKLSEAFTADEARKKAKQYSRAVDEGRDPLGAKKALRESLTCGELFDLYLNSASFAAKAEKTQTVDRSRIDRHLRPLLGSRHVHLLTADGVRRAHDDIRDGKTARKAVKVGLRAVSRVRGGDGAARKSVRLLKAIFAWAVQEGLIAENPAATVKTGSDGERETILEDADGYARLFRTLDQMERERRIRQQAADVIRVIALTGARLSEIVALTWAQVDLKNGRIVIERGGHKTGGRTGKPRIIALPAPAQAIIARQEEGEPGDRVFPPARGEGVISINKPWTQVRAAAKLPADLGLHGLRHTLASHMAMEGAEAAQIMTALGHRQLSTTQRYIHYADRARAALADKAAAVALAGMAKASGEDEDEDQDEATA